jgi:glycosyltransferase involved in cell wall biosynthesis
MKAKKKVLILTYYWPPGGGGGVQRWLKFVKYIREFGWEPIIYTQENGEMPVIDHSLSDQLPEDIHTIRTPIKEPYTYYKWLLGKRKKDKVYSGFINDKKTGFKHKLSIFIRGNFFIPDARMWWIKPSIKFLSKKINHIKPDLIVSTGPPHSMHLIAMGIKKKFDIPWVADFRDPWTKIDFYDQLHLTKWGDRKHKKLEKRVLSKADRVVTVSPSWAKDFKEISSRDDIGVINNGFDPADFNSNLVELDTTFSICHIGSMNKDRNPVVLWEALKSSLDNKEIQDQLEIKLIGQIDNSIVESLKEHGLYQYLKHIPQLKHIEAIQEMRKSQLLLLPINNTPNLKGVLPGKLYEYLGAVRPIICIAPEVCDAKDIIEETKSGKVIGYQEVEKMQEAIKEWFELFKKDQLNIDSENTEQYSRKELIKQYCLLFDQLRNN